MPYLHRLLKYVHATSSAFFSHQNISKNTYFQITKKNGSEISLHVCFKFIVFNCGLKTKLTTTNLQSSSHDIQRICKCSGGEPSQ